MIIDAIMARAPVIPVLVIDGAVDPVALAETLVDAGLPVIEVTLRTPGAMDAMRAMARITGACRMMASIPLKPRPPSRPASPTRRVRHGRRQRA